MRLLSLTAGLAAALMTSSAVLAQGDGFYTVSYNDISFDLTQVDGYGELIVKPMGFGSMAFGECVVNFSLDEAGAIKERAAVFQRNAASCPNEMDWTLSKGEKGMYKIAFTKGGDLAGETFDLFPVLLPMQPEWATKMPQGYDILGIAPGETREATEAKLTAEGYVFSEDDSHVQNYQGGHSRSNAVYTKGPREGFKPADQIAITYTTKISGSDAAERSIIVARRWSIPAEAKVSYGALTKSLADKYGQGNSVDHGVYYDTEGNVASKAFQLSCRDDLHFQQMQNEVIYADTNDFMSSRLGCGPQLKVYAGESYENPGLAGILHLTLSSPDASYEDFWSTWSAGEALALKERFELQAGSTEGPKL